MSKSIAFKTRVVQVIVRENYTHTVNRDGEDQAIEEACDNVLYPIKDEDIIYRETIWDWNDLAISEVTEILNLGVDDDGDE